uniref:Uncharacterized protein n=1 Tax=Triticum urartu TaxID=4572 RepID=A0A8R7VC93_TRIUA
MEESNVQIRPPILPSLCWRNRNGKGRPTCVLDQEVENRPTSTWPLCHAMPVCFTSSVRRSLWLTLHQHRCCNPSTATSSASVTADAAITQDTIHALLPLLRFLSLL